MALICLCHGVSDRTIRGAVGAGAGSIDEVGVACRAGTSCASCHDVIEELVREGLVVHRGRHAAA
ncbi:MAG: (2Fe-2S)-binding protein [Acidimicrobiia bacterium]|nr:(2Fe-2S)-binding protein [Acidimicrobiia bacterium]